MPDDVRTVEHEIAATWKQVLALKDDLDRKMTDIVKPAVKALEERNGIPEAKEEIKVLMQRMKSLAAECPDQEVMAL